MTIGLVAVSGVRAANAELMAAGLSVPGFVERSRVIASLPSLGLLTLAALTPPDIDVDYVEVRDLTALPELPAHWDLVAISSYTGQIGEAYRLADRARATGCKVVLGGLHVTALPDEAARHADAVVVGEGEPAWPRLIRDWRHGELHSRYRPADGERFDLAHAQVPRYELLDPERYNRLTIQTTRGCPHQCEFCASSILLTPHYAVKPVERVIDELHHIKSVWAEPYIELADDNSLVQTRHTEELLAAFSSEGVHWFTEADIGLAAHPERLEALRESGCRMVLIGLESPTPEGVDGIELRRNWKRAQWPNYAAAVERIQAAGIAVIGCFVLGLDGDDETVFDQVYQFADETALFDVQLTVLTPFPGTPLYARLERAGRLLEPGAWDKCTLFDVNYHPCGMTADRLQQGLLELGLRVYDEAFVKARRKRFFAGLRRLRREGARVAEEWVEAG